MEEGREGRLEAPRKIIGVLAGLDMEQHIVEDVEEMQTAPLCRRQPLGSVVLGFGSERVGEGNQILGQGGDASRRRHEISQGPLLAGLQRKQRTRRKL